MFIIQEVVSHSKIMEIFLHILFSKFLVSHLSLQTIDSLFWSIVYAHFLFKYSDLASISIASLKSALGKVTNGFRTA